MRPDRDSGRSVGGVARVDETDEVQFVVDGTLVRSLAGRSLAGALHEAGVRKWRRNPVTGDARGPFCGMGVCFECEVTVDNRPNVRACMVPVSAHMRVHTVPEDRGPGEE